MAGATTVIGRATRVQGRVTGEGDLDVQGIVRGEISIGGEAIVDAGGMVDGNVTARRLVVRGAIKGDLLGRDAVILEDGARVVGDIRAPRVAIAQGALVRGFVEADPGEGSRASSARDASARMPAVREVAPVPRGASSAASRPGSSRAEPAHVQAAVARVVSSSQASSSPRGAVAPGSHAAAPSHAAGGSLASQGHPAQGVQASTTAQASEATNHAGARRAPPPVLPSLKRARGQLVKKKER